MALQFSTREARLLWFEEKMGISKNRPELVSPILHSLRATTADYRHEPAPTPLLVCPPEFWVLAFGATRRV